MQASSKDLLSITWESRVLGWWKQWWCPTIPPSFGIKVVDDNGVQKQFKCMFCMCCFSMFPSRLKTKMPLAVRRERSNLSPCRFLSKPNYSRQQPPLSNETRSTNFQSLTIFTMRFCSSRANTWIDGKARRVIRIITIGYLSLLHPFIRSIIILECRCMTRHRAIVVNTRSSDGYYCSA